MNEVDMRKRRMGRLLEMKKKRMQRRKPNRRRRRSGSRGQTCGGEEV